MQQQGSGSGNSDASSAEPAGRWHHGDGRFHPEAAAAEARGTVAAVREARWEWRRGRDGRRAEARREQCDQRRCSRRGFKGGTRGGRQRRIERGAPYAERSAGASLQRLRGGKLPLPLEVPTAEDVRRCAGHGVQRLFVAQLDLPHGLDIELAFNASSPAAAFSTAASAGTASRSRSIARPRTDSRS